MQMFAITRVSLKTSVCSGNGPSRAQSSSVETGAIAGRRIVLGRFLRKSIMKRTTRSKVRRARTHGFLVRMKTRGRRACHRARQGRTRFCLTPSGRVTDSTAPVGAGCTHGRLSCRVQNPPVRPSRRSPWRHCAFRLAPVCAPTLRGRSPLFPVVGLLGAMVPKRWPDARHRNAIKLRSTP